MNKKYYVYGLPNLLVGISKLLIGIPNAITHSRSHINGPKTRRSWYNPKSRSC